MIAINIHVNGAGGRVGSVLCQLLQNSTGEHHLVGIDLQPPSNDRPVDVVIDFSHHTTAYDLCTYCRRYRLPLVIATTGHTAAEQTAIRQAAKHIPVFWAANLSLGIALLQHLATDTAKYMSTADIAITEQHRRGKVDAPSGTALQLEAAIKHILPAKAISVHALRLGNLAGKHSILFVTEDETITLTHETHTPHIYAKGAIKAAEYVIAQAPGLYGMQQLTRHIQKEAL